MLKEALERIRSWLPYRRRYPAYFEATSQSGKEINVVRSLLEAMNVTGEREFRNLRTAQDDPPDCLVDDSVGATVGVEVTEFVCEEAARRNQRGEAVYRDWQPTEVFTALCNHILAKDGKEYLGGPYSRLVLVVHTAEPVVDPESVARALPGRSLSACQQLTDAFLLFRYDPALGYCPFLRLSLGLPREGPVRCRRSV